MLNIAPAMESYGGTFSSGTGMSIKFIMKMLLLDECVNATSLKKLETPNKRG